MFLKSIFQLLIKRLMHARANRLHNYTSRLKTDVWNYVYVFPRVVFKVMAENGIILVNLGNVISLLKLWMNQSIYDL